MDTFLDFTLCSALFSGPVPLRSVYLDLDLIETLIISPVWPVSVLEFGLDLWSQCVFPGLYLLWILTVFDALLDLCLWTVISWTKTGKSLTRFLFAHLFSASSLFHMPVIISASVSAPQCAPRKATWRAPLLLEVTEAGRHLGQAVFSHSPPVTWPAWHSQLWTNYISSVLPPGSAYCPTQPCKNSQY